MARAVVSAVATALVLLTAPAVAADYAAPYGSEPAPRRVVMRSAVIGPACHEGLVQPSILLRCPPQVQVTPPTDDILAWNDLIGIDRVQRKPYRELFSWSN